MYTLRLLLALCLLFVLIGCKKTAPKSDSTPPALHLSHWEKNSSGGQGTQTTIYPGHQTQVQTAWLGLNKADIRVVGDDDPGVTKLQVSGSATGKCAATDGSQFWDAPGLLSASFPPQTKTVDSGYVQEFLAIHLDDLITKPSCGNHQYVNMPKPQEFFMTSGTWTITAHTENCCGGTADGTFTIVMQ